MKFPKYSELSKDSFDHLTDYVLKKSKKKTNTRIIEISSLYSHVVEELLSAPGDKYDIELNIFKYFKFTNIFFSFFSIDYICPNTFSTTIMWKKLWNRMSLKNF